MTLRIDSGFALSHAGRYLIIRTNTRKFTLYAPTIRVALEWMEALQEFYSVSPRALPTELCPTANPIRFQNHDLQIFTCSSEYFHAVSVALLSARVEIFIAAYMLSPDLILTRPPLPPSRLDQILRFKVDQGVKLYILLNKQVINPLSLPHWTWLPPCSQDFLPNSSISSRSLVPMSSA
jgi:phosphatidylserine/phosphatidylglycerophosphate/cardiolipin synthase-like enzyme